MPGLSLIDRRLHLDTPPAVAGALGRGDTIPYLLGRVDIQFDILA